MLDESKAWHTPEVCMPGSHMHIVVYSLYTFMQDRHLQLPTCMGIVQLARKSSIEGKCILDLIVAHG